MSVADDDGPEEVGGHLVRGQVDDGHPPAPSSVLGGGHAAHTLLELWCNSIDIYREIHPVMHTFLEAFDSLPLI